MQHSPPLTSTSPKRTRIIKLGGLPADITPHTHCAIALRAWLVISATASQPSQLWYAISGTQRSGYFLAARLDSLRSNSY